MYICTYTHRKMQKKKKKKTAEPTMQNKKNYNFARNF